MNLVELGQGSRAS